MRIPASFCALALLAATALPLPATAQTAMKINISVAQNSHYGVAIVEKVDKAKFQATLAPVYVDFGKRFGQDNINWIKNYK